MGRISYLTRRDGRYYVQARLARHVATMAGRKLYRATLRTADYRQARQRLVECMSWVTRMNDTIDYVSLFQMNAVQLRTYLADSWPISEERLLARQQYEELLKNMTRRAKAVGFDPEMIEPDLTSLLNLFVRQNVDADAWHRKLENRRHYEQGRADAEASNALNTLPASFRSVSVSLPTNGQAAASTAQTDQTSHLPHALVLDVPPFHIKHSDQPLPLSSVPAALPQAVDAGMALPIKAPLSQVLADYIADDKAQGGNADARSIVKLIVQFIVDVRDDPTMEALNAEMAEEIDRMLPDIPNRPNIPREDTRTLATRYRYAQRVGWDKLERLTEARLGGYHKALSRFFDWAIEQGRYPYSKPIFKKTSGENLVSIQRDAFNDNEVRAIFSQPLFIGCATASRMWTPGACLVQNHLYWGYILSMLTGLRAGEIGQIELNDIEETDGIFYLQLRGFDPSKGRVARKSVKRFKTVSSHRTIPLHPLILDLGLLERVDALRKIKCPVLFPEWEPYPKPDGELRWGQPLTKSFQYLKKKINLTRFDVALYSSRHWFAEQLDKTDIKHRTRMQIMGHASRKDMPGRYGQKQRLTTRDLKLLVEASSPIIDDMAELLMGAKLRADAGELDTPKTWLLRQNWSQHYRQKLGVGELGK
jgi:integrase